MMPLYFRWLAAGGLCCLLLGMILGWAGRGLITQRPTEPNALLRFMVGTVTMVVWSGSMLYECINPEFHTDWWLKITFAALLTAMFNVKWSGLGSVIVAMAGKITSESNKSETPPPDA